MTVVTATTPVSLFAYRNDLFKKKISRIMDSSEIMGFGGF